MAYFWLLVILVCLVVGIVMGLLGRLAREVPDRTESAQPRRLNPDTLRLLAYALIIIICLIGAMYELHLMYTPVEQ